MSTFDPHSTRSISLLKRSGIIRVISLVGFEIHRNWLKSQKSREVVIYIFTYHECSQTRGPWVCHFFPHFSQKMDFWATTWSQDAQNIFLETLEIFWKIPRKKISKFLPWALLMGPSKLSPCQKITFAGGWEGQKSLMTQKIDFFKVRDIDTSIQPRKKKHQTNVSSALKLFRTTCGVSEIIAKIWIFALPLHVSAGIPAENAHIFAIVSETPQMVLKRF